MKKIIIFLSFIYCYSVNSIAKINQFYYNFCRTVLNNGGGGYSTADRVVDNHYDLYGILIGQDVTIFCAGNGYKACPQSLANPSGGGGEDIYELPANVLLYCEVLFEDLCDGEDNELFPLSISVLGSDGIVYYIAATITEMEGGKKYNLLITAN
ncbi:MAG: hypothetical protein IT243_03445 [Bacteroidia bacterium]|nr:hypothetical protein [Bacteroidia bacterium]